MLKEIVGMTKVAYCIHATKIMWFHRLQTAYREPTKRFTWIQHARPNLAACNVPISGIMACTKRKPLLAVYYGIWCRNAVKSPGELLELDV